MASRLVLLALRALAAGADEGGLVIEPLAPPPAEAPPAPGLAIEPLAPSPPAAGPPSSTRVYGTLSLASGADTRWEPLEHVVELRDRLVAGVEHRAGADVRLVLEAKLDHWLVARKPSRAHPLGRRRKADFEVLPGEAYLDVRAGPVDLRLGNQVLSFAANPGFAAAEPLVPLDLRRTPPPSDPEAVKLPVPAARAVAPLAGCLDVEAVWVPLVIPSRLAATGSDVALVQPGSPIGLPDPTAFLDPTAEERFEEALLPAARPRAYLLNGDGALGLACRAGDLDVKVTHSEAWDKLPHVSADPLVQRVLAGVAEGRNPATDPGLQADLLALQQRLAAGEASALVASELGRTRTTALAATALAGPVQLALDLAFTPVRTVYVLEENADGTTAFRPRTKKALAGALGISDARGGPWILEAQLGLDATFGVEADESLFLLEPPGASGVDRTALRPVAGGVVSRRLLDDRLTLGAGALVGLRQRDFLVSPRAAYRPRDGVELALAAELVDGPVGSLGGYFARNDRVVFEVALLF